MTSTADRMLGIGVYTAAEAALYARVSTQTINRWLYGNQAGEAVLRPQLGAEKIVTFLDFIQALHINHIRTEYEVSLRKIREGIEEAKKTYKVDYPLAMQHKTYIYGKDLVIRMGDEYFQITGKERRHRMLHQIVNLYGKDLTYEDGLASRYRAYVHGNFEIWMNPQIRFGEPLLPSCGYSARALWESARTEGDFERAADVNGVTADEVEVAYRYYNSIKLPRAA